MLDELTVHQIYIQRYSKSITRDVLPILKKTRDEVVARISTATTFEISRLSVLLREINALIDGNMEVFQSSMTLELTEFAEYEADFVTKLLTESTTITATGVSAEQVMATASKSKMELVVGKDTQKLSFDQAVAQFSKRQKKDIALKIRSGIVEGKTTAQIARDIRRMYNTRTRQQAEALVTTLTNHTGTIARAEVWGENSEYLEGEMFSAVLDSRTTLVCMGLDHKIFPVGVGAMPPLHWNCRSVRVPVIKDEYDLFKDTTRASEEGPVNARTTYNSFLKRQSKSVQDDILGPERAKLFRAGTHVDKFTDRNGVTLTLDELKAKNF
jgi:SPP1 gp7 family putative phage head morphogenesis protein